MKLGKSMTVALFALSFVVAGCGGPAQGATMGAAPAAVEPATVGPTATAATEPGTMPAMPAATAAMLHNPTGLEAPTALAGGAADGESQPAWFSTPLAEVNTGQTIEIAGFKGKVVLVENMAIWCTTCLAQQKQVKALHAAMGETPDLVSLALDVDPNENGEALKAYTAKNGFDWLYAVAPRDMARAVSQRLGDQFLNPPSAPMFVIDRQGGIHPLPFGVKSAEQLQAALAPYLAGQM